MNGHSHKIHVWYIYEYLHLVAFYGTCRWIYQSHGSYEIWKESHNPKELRTYNWTIVAILDPVLGWPSRWEAGGRFSIQLMRDHWKPCFHTPGLPEFWAKIISLGAVLGGRGKKGTILDFSNFGGMVFRCFPVFVTDLLSDLPDFFFQHPCLNSRDETQVWLAFCTSVLLIFELNTVWWSIRTSVLFGLESFSW